MSGIPAFDQPAVFSRKIPAISNAASFPGSRRCHLLQLPCELVEIIASYIPASALCHLRLTCVEIESKTWRYFATSNFRELRVMASQHALDSLIALSKLRMAEFIQTLILEQYSHPGRIDATEAKLAILGFDEECEPRASSQDEKRLELVFRNIPGIKNLVFRQSLDRMPRTPGCLGKSYVEKLHSENNLRIWKPVLQSHTLIRLLEITLRAAEKARLDLHSIDALTREVFKPDYDHKDIHFRSFPLGISVGSHAIGVWANLTVLRLCPIFESELEDFQKRLHLAEHISAFIERAPALRTLGLSFTLFCCHFEFLKLLISKEPLRKIDELELVHIVINTASLKDCLAPLMGTLRRIGIYWASNVRFLMHESDLKRWIKFVEWLQRDFPCLNVFDVEPAVFDTRTEPSIRRETYEREDFGTLLEKWQTELDKKCVEKQPVQ